MSKWDERFLTLAAHVATWSKDPSTKVGAAIVGPVHREVRSMGYNGLPRGVADTDRRLADRELKYDLVVHAEENAILNLSLYGGSADGCTLYTTHPPCVRCATAIIQAGIRRVAWPPVEVKPHHEEALKLTLAQDILVEAKVLHPGASQANARRGGVERGWCYCARCRPVSKCQ